jgi:hypothetical protein
LTDVKNVLTQLAFCMLLYAASAPSMLPFMPYSTSTGIMPRLREWLTRVVVRLDQLPISLPIRYW